MPFKSQAQRRFMYATDPEMAKRWEKDTPKGRKLPDKVKKGEPSSNKSQAARALVGGGLIGTGVGVGTGVGHYAINKEYYNKLTQQLREGLTGGEKRLVSELKNRGWLGRRVARRVKPGTLQKSVPGWSSVSKEVAKGSKRIGRAAGLGSGALAALTILTLEKMRDAEHKSKKASAERAYLLAVLGL